jgi:hypothetical protein
MHARPEIRQLLIAKKMKRWVMISKYPALDPSCPPARARKNYWRLFQRYREIAAKIGLHELSVY